MTLIDVTNSTTFSVQKDKVPKSHKLYNKHKIASNMINSEDSWC